MKETSDLIGIRVVLWAILAVGLVLVAFFFVGAVAGIIALFVVIILAAVMAGRWILAADESE